MRALPLALLLALLRARPAARRRTAHTATWPRASTAARSRSRPTSSGGAWSLRAIPAWPPRRVTVHHTVTRAALTREESEATMQEVYRGHLARPRYIDIGYNIVIDAAGRPIEARGMELIGAHTEGQNIGNVGISLMGNLELAPPTAAQQTTLVLLAGAAAYTFDMDTSAQDFMLGHRDNPGANTACPGRHAYELLPRWREQVRDEVHTLGALALESRREGRRFLAFAIVRPPRLP